MISSQYYVQYGYTGNNLYPLNNERDIYKCIITSVYVVKVELIVLGQGFDYHKRLVHFEAINKSRSTSL